MADLRQVAQGYQELVVSWRAMLHANPETRWEEDVTLGVIQKMITNSTVEPGIKIEVLPGFTGGLVVDMTFDASFPRVIFRADVDALPVKESTGLKFASRVDGKMHACGHDVHSAMLLGGFFALAKGEAQPNRNIRFVWQRAEENPGTGPRPESGGEVLVKEGVLTDVSAAYGLHIWNNPEPKWGTPGVFYSRPGGFLGNSGRLQIKVSCSGGHAAKPYSGTNALRVTAAIQDRLNTFLARHLAPGEPGALEPVILLAGTATETKNSSNVMPASAELWYGVRTALHRNAHNSLMAEVEQEVRYVAAQFGADVGFNRILGHPALINTPASFEQVSSILRDAGEQVEVHGTILGGEDFAHYLYGVPGSFWMLGAYTPGTGDHHAPTFSPDESVFWKGVLFWLLLATS